MAEKSWLTNSGTETDLAGTYANILSRFSFKKGSSSKEFVPGSSFTEDAAIRFSVSLAAVFSFLAVVAGILSLYLKHKRQIPAISAAFGLLGLVLIALGFG